MIRVGTGYDLHVLVPDRPLILAGVRVPHSLGLAGHSDADVLAHAITDALLGAAALGNIGQHFPDTDPAYKGADSLQLLRRALGLLEEAGYRVVNVDSTLVAQQPKLNPHIAAMRENLAGVLGVPVDRVSVKAKTNERVGPEGREEAISAQAAVLIEGTDG
jgi:2-C-methyl-D-erythritol 2,4-cyclodiphosphate synthase